MKYFSFVLALSVLFSCRKQVEKDACTPEQFLYKAAAGRQVVIPAAGNQYQVVAGSDIVFEYSHVFRDCPELSDDDGTDNLVFQIPAGATSFTYTDAALASIKCYSQVSCFCAFTDAIAVNQGTVSGTLSAPNTWNVGVNVSVSVGGSTRTYRFTQTFVVQ